MKHSEAPRRMDFAAVAGLHLAFFATGVITALLGPLLPAAREQLGVTTGQIALLFTAQFAAGAAGALFSQYGKRYWASAGLLLSTVGLFWFASAAWPTAIAAWALVGFGVGAAIPAINMLVAHAFTRRAAAVNFLNFVWGAGAACSPVFLRYLYRVTSYQRALIAYAVLAAAVAIIVAFTTRREPAPSGIDEKQRPEGRGSVAAFVVFCLMLFLYIGIETTFSGWLPTHAASAGSGSEAAARAAFLFWAALVLGRAVFAAALTKIPERVTAIAVIAGIAVTLAAQMFARSSTQVAAIAVVAGVACAPVFALILSRIAAYAEECDTNTPGWVFSVASLGGATVPWLYGQAAERFSSSHVAFAVPLTGSVVLLALVFVVFRRATRMA